MKEHVGVCHLCRRDIYCQDGFVNGVIDEEGRLACFDCSTHEQEKGIQSENENH